MNLKSKDIGIMTALVIVGMALMYMLISAKVNTFLLALIGLAVGSVLLVAGLIGQMVARTKKPYLELTDSVSIPSGSCIDIIFAPMETLTNPHLTLSSLVYDLDVEEIWHGEKATLGGKARALYQWHSGKTYPGAIDHEHALIARIRNKSPNVAIVSARLVGRAKKA